MERTYDSNFNYAAGQSPVALGHLPVRLFSNFMLWQRRINTRRELARLDERLLADAGISEAQRQRELKKPFWR